ncbi:MAG: hypothetical protein AB1918_08005, partial [Pseudomonadota bacterium]
RSLEGNGNSLHESSTIKALGHALAKNTELGRLTSRLLSPLFRKSATPPEIIQRSAQLFLDRHGEAKTLCAELKVTCHFFMQPMIGDKQPHGVIETRIMDDTNLTYPGFDQAYREFAAIALAAAPDIVDLRSALDGVEGTLFNDTIHVIGLGNRLLATTIIGHIGAELGLDQRPR